MKKWDEQLADLSVRLAELSEKAEKASAEAKEAREYKTEAIKDNISTAKGDMVAFQEKVRLAEEEGKNKLSVALLKAQMKLEARVQDRKDQRDKAYLECYMEDRIVSTMDSLEIADYMLANAFISYCELAEAAAEYNERFGENEEEA